MCDLFASRCNTYWKPVFLVILTCLVVTQCEEILLKHPKCRTNCRRYRTLSDTTFFYYVKGAGRTEEQPLIVQYDQKKKSYLMKCNSQHNNYDLAADDPALPVMPKLTIVKTIEFQGCLVPNVPYAYVLADLNITFSSNHKDGVLKLRELTPTPQLKGYHLKGLPIKELLITSANVHPPTRPKSDFLDHLPELKNLKLEENVEPEKETITHLPESLVELSLINTKLTLDDDGSWLMRLNSLKSLALEDYGLVTLPPLSLLRNLTKVVLNFVTLALSDNTTWLKGTKLQSLTINYCEFKELPNELFLDADIAEIDLSNNELNCLNDAFEPLRSSLRILDLSNNNLDGTVLVNAVRPLEKLDKLIVNNNPLSLCPTDVSSQLPKTFRHLELKNTKTTRICFDWIQNESLLNLILDDNVIEYLWYSDLNDLMRRVKNETVTLSLKNNRLLRINHMTQKDYNNCMKYSSSKNGGETRSQVNLKLDLSVCDCNAYWLQKMLLECTLLKPAAADDVTCTKRTSLVNVHSQNLTCPYRGPCPKECSCDKRPHDNATVVWCKGALPQAPPWPPAAQDYPLALHVAPGTLNRVPNLKLVELHAPNNNITKLDEKDLPSTLRVLDVRNNSIAHITFAAAEQLLRLSRANRCNVTLAGNPLACGCEDEAAIEKLQHAKIWDWNTTQCADHQLIFGKTKLCRDIILPTLLSVMGALLILTLAALVVVYLRPRIRQFFFDHNCCLQCLFTFKDDPHDPSKTHDLFISYSFNDHECAKKLIEKLEGYGHSTIEHCRDWLPGRTITQQITDSVLSARRTLLLVSDNYANSQWGLEEFHAAHAHAIERGLACVIVIRCNLLDPEKLPNELRLYLSNNTYLDWSDRYFWKKLLKVMPRPQATQQVSTISLPQDKMVQPPAGIQFVPPPLSRVSLDKELPLSELVLVPPIQQPKNGSQQSSGQASPVTPMVREPPKADENKSPLTLDIQRDPVMTLRMPAVA